MEHKELQYEVTQWVNSSTLAPSIRLQVLQLQAELNRNILFERIADATESFAETLESIRRVGLAVEHVSGH